MSEKKRLHPISVIANIVKQLKDAFFPLVLLIIVGNRTISTVWDIAVPLAVVIYTIVIGIVSWLRFTYRLEEGELRIEQGVFVRKKRYIPFERIQGISISEGFLQRLAGVVKVNIETAGNQFGEAEVVLTAVTREEAEQIQRWIRKAKETMNDETENTASSFVSINQPLQEESKNIIFSMSFWEVFQVAVTSGGALSVIAAIFFFISQFDELIPYERLYKDAQTMLFAHGLFYTMMAVLLIFIVAYIISIIQNMLRYAFFTVEKIDENIIISRGLLERRKVTTPVARVQGIVIKENMIRRWLGYASVYIIHAGGALDDGRQGNIILCPLIKKERIASVISSCLPEYDIHHEFNALPKRACIRYMSRPLYVLILPVCIAAYFLRPWGLLLLLLLPIVSYFGYLSYKEAGWAISPHQLALRSGLFNVKSMYMLKNRIQSMEASFNWFQKRKHLGTIAATVMPGTDARGEVVDLDQEDVKTIYAWLKRTNEAS
ncbi:membrane-flanked domain-containing protein [Parageobacillus genomosp. 1]|uniref:Membrane-flanked domain-containing protein n=1 Tax=Parageobacillus genomosp. 1 TaxID=1295642 RepID=A0ABC9VEL5_9BACL|nr:PH domain-containing protein [Parageobacillus genomosp. 1]EZP76722.1 membrane-flanked domain-containing protein [Parageobacillus genomosp. 1]